MGGVLFSMTKRVFVHFGFPPLRLFPKYYNNEAKKREVLSAAASAAKKERHMTLCGK